MDDLGHGFLSWGGGRVSHEQLGKNAWIEERECIKTYGEKSAYLCLLSSN